LSCLRRLACKLLERLQRSNRRRGVEAQPDRFASD
jgi:hypothetical protein